MMIVSEEGEDEKTVMMISELITNNQKRCLMGY